MARRTTKKAATKKAASGTGKKTASAKKKSTRAATAGRAKRSTKKTASPIKRKIKKTATKKAAKKAAKKTTKKATAKKATVRTTKTKKAGAKTAKIEKKGVRTTRIKKNGLNTTKVKKVTTSRAASLAPVPSVVEEAKPKRIKSHLKKKDLEAFRTLLLTKRDLLVGDMTNMTDEALSKSRQSASGDLSNMPIHMADLGSDNFEQEFTLGLIENEHSLLREINEALQRIEDGTYGICLATGKPITKTRLRAKPWAKYCIEHARRLERGF